MKKERELPLLLHEISLMEARIFNRRVKEIGLTKAQWHVLYLLHDSDGQTQTALAKHLDMAKPSLGKIIDRLEEDEWVTRRPDTQDRRVNLVYVTRKIEQHLELMELVTNELYAILTSGLTTKENRQLISLVRKVHRNLSDEPSSDLC